MMPKPPINVEEHIGKIYAQWTVLRFADYNGTSLRFWCRCTCGNERRVRFQALQAQESQRCRECAELNKSVHEVKGEIISNYLVKLTAHAKTRNIDVHITLQDLDNQWKKQSGVCAISGIPITVKKKNTERTSASVDRIDSSQGYTVENIQWVHKDINKIKLNLDLDYFIELCTRVAEHQGTVLH